jgi:hypothetical protein
MVITSIVSGGEDTNAMPTARQSASRSAHRRQDIRRECGVRSSTFSPDSEPPVSNLLHRIVHCQQVLQRYVRLDYVAGSNSDTPIVT